MAQRFERNIQLQDLDDDAFTVKLNEFLQGRNYRLFHSTAEFFRLYIAISSAIRSILRSIQNFLIRQLENPHLSVENLVKEAEKAFVNELSNSRSVVAIISSASQEPIELYGSPGRYVVVVDPLNGVDLLDTLTPTGTIFSVYRLIESSFSKNDYLRPASEMVGGGYALYSYQTFLVMNVFNGGGLTEFIFDNQLNEFVVTLTKMEIPNHSQFYSVDEGETELWEQDAILKYILTRKDPLNSTESELYYSGSLVQDIHFIIKCGGIYMSPKNSEELNGKLSLVFHCAPLAYLLHEAGGSATSGQMDIINVLPTDVWQNSPFYAGSFDDVNDFLAILNDIRVGFKINWQDGCSN